MSSPLPSPADGATYLYLLRHGATDNNVAHPPRLQGRGHDGPLSAVGIAQSQAAARLLADRPLVAVYSSPLLRARQTAEFLAAPHGLSVGLIDALVEVDVGSWEGRDWAEIERSEPEAFRRFMEDPAQHGYAGGESLGAVQQRVLPAILQLLTRHAGQSIAVVAHNNVNRCVLANVLGSPLAKARAIAQENCAVNLIRVGADQAMSVMAQNYVEHLRGSAQ
ncbi:MAG: histidine phosphatase family protein [Planctomycetia bacterium]|nr:histidine phosphatase family protein [Planctomycetia bacterium]